MFTCTSEVSQFGGFRALVLNPQGKMSYLSAKSYVSHEIAAEAASVYIEAYLRHGDRHANNMIHKFNKAN